MGPSRAKDEASPGLPVGENKRYIHQIHCGNLKYLLETVIHCYDVKQRFQQNCYKLCGEPIPELALASLACRGSGDITYNLQSVDYVAFFWTNEPLYLLYIIKPIPIIREVEHLCLEGSTLKWNHMERL